MTRSRQGLWVESLRQYRWAVQRFASAGERENLGGAHALAAEDPDAAELPPVLSFCPDCAEREFAAQSGPADVDSLADQRVTLAVYAGLTDGARDVAVGKLLSAGVRAQSLM